MTRLIKGAMRLYKPKNDTTIIKARVTTIEKFQFEDFCNEYAIKLSNLLRLEARFIMRHPELVDK